MEFPNEVTSVEVTISMVFLLLLCYDIVMGRERKKDKRRRPPHPSTGINGVLALSPFAPDCVDQIYLIAASGLSDSEIARVCGVSASKLARWRILYGDLDKAILNGRLSPDMHVVQAAYRRAVGYDIPHSVRTETTDADGNVSVAVKSESVHIPPDPASQRFWLQNRAGERWKDKRTEEKVVTHELGARLERALQRAGASRSLPPSEFAEAVIVPAGDSPPSPTPSGDASESAA
jgi:hypothetical protein